MFLVETIDSEPDIEARYRITDLHSPHNRQESRHLVSIKAIQDADRFHSIVKISSGNQDIRLIKTH
jgi:hypothetical protein